MKKLIPAALALIVLSACSSPPPPPMQQTNYSLPSKINLDVQSLNYADRSVMVPNSPYASNPAFQPTIANAIRQWASDRLQATGASGSAVLVVKDASLTAVPLQMEHGIGSWFTRQQAVKYVGHAEIELQANGAQGNATANARADRSVTLPEDATDAERRDAYFTLLNGLMRDLGMNMEGALNDHSNAVNAFITAAPMGGNTIPVPQPMPSSYAPPLSPNQSMQ